MVIVTLSKYLSLHNEVKDSIQDNDFIYTDGSVSCSKPAAAPAVVDKYSCIERLQNKSSIFSALGVMTGKCLSQAGFLRSHTYSNSLWRI